MSDNPVFDRIQSEIDTNDVVLFMKGSPMFPQCGFSAAVTQALTTLEVKFKGVDVMEDGDIRNGIKDFTNWPTIPQLYVKGEFVGQFVKSLIPLRISLSSITSTPLNLTSKVVNA